MVTFLSICNTSTGVYMMYYVKILLLLIRIVVPIILILSCMISVVRTITSHDTDMLSKMLKSWVTKIIAAILVFMIPTFVYLIGDLVSSSSDVKSCIQNASISRAKELKEKETKEKEKALEEWKKEQERIIAEKKKAEEERKAKQRQQQEQQQGGTTGGGTITTTSLTKVNMTDIGCDEYYSSTLHREYLYFNSAVADDVHAIFVKMCAYVNSSPYVSRIQDAGSYVNKAGYHGRGLAVDLFTEYTVTKNGKTYRPYGQYSYAEWDNYKRFVCEVCDGNEACPENINYHIYHNIFQQYGWCWGGNWNPQYYDPMHYEKTDGGCSTTRQTAITCN